MSGLKSLAALIGGIGVGMSGYARGQAQFQQNERQKKLDAREDAEYERQQGKVAKADKLEADVAASQADQVVENVPSYDLTSMGGGDPEKQETVGYKAGGQVFGEEGAAKAALWGVNSTAEKERRAAQVMRSAGQLDKARQYEEFAKRAIDEGTDQILGGIQAMAPSVDAVKQAGGKVAGTVGQGLADVFNRTGSKWKVSSDTMVEHFIAKDAAGREIVNSRVIGKDGKPVVDDVRGAQMMLLGMKERLAQQNAETKIYQDGQQIAETGRHNKAGEDLTRARDAEAASNNRAQRSIQQQGVNLQARRLDMEAKSFKKQTLAGQIEEIEEAAGVKLTPEERKQFAGIGKKGGKASDGNALMDKIIESSVKTWQENNPTATPGQVATYVAKLQSDLGAARNNVIVENTVQQELAGKKPGTPEYAQAWQAAQAVGMTEQQLVARGYALPKAAPASPMQRTAAAVGTAPPAPKERIWIGNKYEVNPAYVEWDKRYGAATRQQQQSENARLISAYDRAKL